MTKLLDTSSLIQYLGGEGSNKKFCFIMGSGCSVENGIPTGWDLSSKWYKELNDIYKNEEIECWKLNENIKDDEFGVNYAKIFKFRFAKQPSAGYDAINAEIEKGRIGIGHVILAQLMLKTGSNVVITTNFDTLVEETLYTFTNSRPVICGHESTARYAFPRPDHPLIIKIHRDRFMEPFNTAEEVETLQPEWISALNHVFERFIPIVIGYGGNDGSLMGYLRNALPCERMFWCVTSERPVRKEIRDVIAHHNGNIIKIESFNRFMLRMIPLYNITDINQVVTEKAHRLADNYTEALITLTRQVSAGDDAGERASIEKLIETYTPEDWWYWELKSRLARSDAEELEIYKAGLEKLPKSPDLNYYYAWKLQDLFPDKAIPFLKKAVRYNPEYSEAWYTLGAIYYRRGQIKRAIQYFQKAVEIKTSFTQAWNQLASCYHTIGDFQRAIYAYKAILTEQPDRSLTWNNLGFTYKTLGEINDAVNCFEKAIESDPTLPQPYFNMGNIFYKAGDNLTAIEYYSKAVKADSNFADAYYNMGLAYENIDEDKKAKDVFYQAFLIRPDDPSFKDRVDLSKT